MLSHSNNNGFPNKLRAFSFICLYYCLGSPSLQIQMCGRLSAKAVFLYYLFIKIMFKFIVMLMVCFFNCVFVCFTIICFYGVFKLLSAARHHEFTMTTAAF